MAIQNDTDNASTTSAETTEAETTEAESTEEEVEELEDIELEVFKESLQGKAKSTIATYLRHYKKLKNELQKDIHDTSQQLIIKTAERLSNNLNSQASYINIGFLVRKLYNQKTDELVKARAGKQTYILNYTKEQNQKSADGLPSLKEFEDHIDYLFKEKRYKEYIINYLIRHCYVRNQDLLFDIVKKKGDAVGNKNFMWLAKGNRVVYIRRNYKTSSTYGEKVTEFNDPQLKHALRSIKDSVIPNPVQVGYYVKKMSYKELGEGLLLKLVLNQTRAAGDWHMLTKISQLRGTDVCTLTSNYNIQQDGDECMATLTRQGKKRVQK